MANLNDYIHGPSTLRIINFSNNKSPIKIQEIGNNEIKNFSHMDGIPTQLLNFTLLDYIREFKQIPRAIFLKRVNEVVNYINSKSAEKVMLNKDYLLNYLNDFLYSQIIKIVNDKSIKQINIIMALGLSRHLSSLTNAKKLQLVLTRMKKQIATTGVMTRAMQMDIKNSYAKLWSDLLTSIDAKRIKSDKKGILTGGNDKDAVK